VDTLLSILVEVLRLVPLILVFYIPSLMAVATWKERGEGYKVKAASWLALSCAAVLLVQLLVRSVSALQVAATVGISLAQLAVALVLAALTVYKLAD
jgi:uncharacterized membrane protein